MAEAGGLAGRLFSLLLHLWPRQMRERLGDEMAATFAARVASRRVSGRPVLPHALRELAGVAWAGMKARRAVARANRSHGSGRGFRMETFVQDVRYALRGSARNPGFTAIVVCVLALGIGANTAIFSVLNATLLRDVPARDPEQLVTILETNPEKGWDGVSAAPANVLDWRADVGAFEDIAMHLDVGSTTLTGAGEPEVLRSVVTTGNWFDVLGVRAQLGRVFLPEETWKTGAPVVLLSDGYWSRRFGRDPAVLGRTLMLGGVAREVVGILARGFSYPNHGIDVWIPMDWEREWREMVWFRRAHFVNTIARVRDGVPFERADAELQTVVQRLQVDYPETNAVMGAIMVPLQEHRTAEMRAPLLLLQGAVLLLLLIACANVGNLLLLRAGSRRREMAVRAALGAGRRRVAALVVTESLILAGAGGMAGVGLGVLAIRMLAGLLPSWLPAEIVTVDGGVLLFALGITVAAGIAFGLAPAARPTEIEAVLREGGRTGSMGRRALRAMNVLVMTEVALALILVLGAGLLLRSFGALRDVDPGFEPADRVTARISVPTLAGTEVAATTAFFDRVHERLDGIPGVRGTAFAATLPLAGSAWTSDFVMRDWEPGRFGAEVTHQTVSPDYFETLEIPVLRGRALQDGDRRDTERVLVINEAMARQFFAGEDPVGRSIAFTRTPTDETQWWRIVGIVGDTRQRGLRSEPPIEVYQTYWQEATGSLAAIVHTTLPASEAVNRIRAAVQEVDPDVPLASVRTFDEIYADSLRSDRFLLVLLGGFAGLALLLAALGVYGVISQATRRRTQEIGIRVALGARRGDVARLILRQALGPVGAGVVLGTAGGFGATRLMRSVLFGIEPGDPTTFLVVPLVLLAVAVAASLVPVRGATRVDPLRALHTE